MASRFVIHLLFDDEYLSWIQLMNKCFGGQVSGDTVREDGAVSVQVALL